MALHNKISSANTWGHKKSPTDAKSTPFLILDVPECRKAMLKFIDEKMDPEQKQAISDVKSDHLKNCHECFRVFSHYSYFTTSDFTLVGIILHEIEEAITTAIWQTDTDGNEFFITENSIGCDGTHGTEFGSFLMIHTGGGKLQGRVASKIYALLLAVMKWNTNKKPVGNAFVNIRDADPVKTHFFAEVYQKFFERNIWTYGDCIANDYLLKLGNAVFKFIDTISNISKSYCYFPSERFKRSLERGIAGIQTTEDKLEIAPHYEAAKRNFKTGITFCSECGDTECALNRAMCIIVAESTDFIQEIRDVPDNMKVKFTLLDFFRRDELEHFIHNFTVPAEHSISENVKLEWMELESRWPRKLKEGVNLNLAALRWDIKKATTYRDGVWNGNYQKWMFEDIVDKAGQIPENFSSLISHVNTNTEDSIFEAGSQIGTLADFSEGEIKLDTPFDDPNVEPKWNEWAETKLSDPSWRKEAKSALEKLIEGTKEFNEMFKGKIQERKAEYHWYSLLQKIETAEKADREVVERNFGAYEGPNDNLNRDIRLANVQTERNPCNTESLSVSYDDMPGKRIKCSFINVVITI